MKPHPTKSKPRIAPGHNPDKLTVAQVGKGWRLLTLQEVKKRAHVQFSPHDLYDIEAWSRKQWDGTGWTGADKAITYRIRKPPGYFLPKKPKPSPRQPGKGARKLYILTDGTTDALCDYKGEYDLRESKSEAEAVARYNDKPLPVLVLDLSPEARERRVLAARDAIKDPMCGPIMSWQHDHIVRAVLASLGDTPAGEGRGK